jgi:hypothetical protein
MFFTGILFLYDRYCRPDPRKKMPVSVLLFPGLYFGYFLTIIALFSG